jgi:hypothetical protein
MLAGRGHLQRLQLVKQLPQRDHCSQPDLRVVVGGRGGELGCLTHACQFQLTKPGLSS